MEFIKVSYEEMKKSKVLENLAGIKAKWVIIEKFIGGLAPHWQVQPVKKVLKNNVELANMLSQVEKKLHLQLQDILLKQDIEELNNLIKVANDTLIEKVSLVNEQDSLELNLANEGKVEIMVNDTPTILGASVLKEMLVDVKNDIIENNKKRLEISFEEKALARAFRKKIL